jgi:putative permease
MILVILILISVIILFVTPHILPSTLLALVSYYFLSPLIFLLHRMGLSWVRSAQIVFFSIGLLLLGISIFLGPPLWQESRELIQLVPEISRTAQVTLFSLIRQLENQLGYSLPTDWTTLVQPYLVQAAGYVGRLLPGFLSQSVVLFFLAPLFTYFFLTEANVWPKKFIQVLPQEWSKPVEQLLQDMHLHIGGFIRARLFESLLVGGLTWGILSLIGLPFSFLLGFLAGALNIIPYIGPVMAILPAIILALSTESPQTTGMLTILTYLVIQALDAFVIVPFFVAKIVNLHSLIVIIAILLGGYMMGLIGMIISIPLAGMLKIVIQHTLIWLEEEK